MSSAAASLTEVAFRTQRWVRQRPFVVDIAVVVLVAALALGDYFDYVVEIALRDPDAVGVALIIAGSMALFWRRTQPIVVLAAIISIVATCYIRGYGTYVAAPAVPAFYSATAHSENRHRAWVAVFAAQGIVFGVGSFTLLDAPDGYRLGEAMNMVILTTAAAVAGAIVRNRHELFVGTEARAREAEVEADRAATNERLRIAREMHDVVTHGVGIMAVQAAAARETLDTQPERARDLLINIENAARESLLEMRRMLGVLRDGDKPDSATQDKLNPQPSLNDLDALVASSTDAGTPTELITSGNPRPLSAGVELAAFRLVQEALTNVRKHAGPDATANVEVHYGPETLHLTITDTGATRPSTSRAGNGLIGMRERVDAYGGQLSTGPRPGGGYQITAQLPTSPPQNRHHRTDRSRTGTQP